MEIKYQRASIKIHNALILNMDLSDLSYRQQVYRINLLCQILHSLHLRKRPKENIWEARVNKRWLGHTSIVLVE